jgi:RNA polymerase sigma-70 factor (ECF subfamily)
MTWHGLNLKGFIRQFQNNTTLGCKRLKYKCILQFLIRTTIKFYNLTEFELNSKIKKGDIDTFEYVFKRFYSRLYAFAHSIVNDDFFAEDLVQDVFTTLWIKREELDDEKPISAFLMKLTKNACLDYLKHQLVEEKYISRQKYSSSQQLYYFDFFKGKAELTLEEELQKSMNKATELMPDKCKVVFRMRWIEGLKNREIAEKLNISVTMVEKHLAKGIKIFRDNFKHEFVLFLILMVNQMNQFSKNF